MPLASSYIKCLSVISAFIESIHTRGLHYYKPVKQPNVTQFEQMRPIYAMSMKKRIQMQSNCTSENKVAAPNDRDSKTYFFLLHIILFTLISIQIRNTVIAHFIHPVGSKHRGFSEIIIEKNTLRIRQEITP